MPDHAGQEPRGIGALHAGRSVRFVPLYHPSMGNSNSYTGAYEALRALLQEC